MSPVPNKPPPLVPGDVIAVVAPSGPAPRERLELGLAFLRDRGFEVRWDAGGFDSWRYLAGDDGRRGAELAAAMRAPEVRCIWVARGGYGAMRLLPDLPWGEVPSPRWLVGFSDVTALHEAWSTRGPGGGAVHGPNVVTLGRVGGTDRDQTFGLLMGTLPPAALGAQGLRSITPGVAEGPLRGGNLSLVTRTLGTPWAADLRGAVLFLEDVGERPYRLDRMLTHLELAGVADVVGGERHWPATLLVVFTRAKRTALFTLAKTIGALADAARYGGCRRRWRWWRWRRRWWWRSWRRWWRRWWRWWWRWPLYGWLRGWRGRRCGRGQAHRLHELPMATASDMLLEACRTLQIFAAHRAPVRWARRCC